MDRASLSFPAPVALVEPSPADYEAREEVCGVKEILIRKMPFSTDGT